jgi:hypothetical protein
MTSEQQSLIIQNIINEVNEKGSSRLGNHAELILKDSLNGKAVPYNIKSKIRGKLIADGKYITTAHPRFTHDFDVTVNPDFKEQTWVERNPGWDKVRTGAITALFTLIVGFTLYYFTTGKDQKDRQESQDKKIKALEANIERKDIFALDRILVNIRYMSLGDSMNAKTIIESLTRFKNYLEEGATNTYLINNGVLLKEWNKYLLIIDVNLEDQKRGRSIKTGYEALSGSREGFCNYFMNEFHEKIVIRLLK